MKKILITWTIIAVLLVGGLTYIGFNLKSKNGAYYLLEEKLVAAAEVYYGQYPGELPASSLEITSTKLIDTNFLDDLNIDDEECTGYVIVTKNNMFYKYKGYIKCKDYTTNKYDASKNVEGSV